MCGDSLVIFFVFNVDNICKSNYRQVSTCFFFNSQRMRTHIQIKINVLYEVIFCVKKIPYENTLTKSRIGSFFICLYNKGITDPSNQNTFKFNEALQTSQLEKF